MDKKEEEPQKPTQAEVEEEEEEEEEEEDLFNKRIENSGCSKQHYQLQVSTPISKSTFAQICRFMTPPTPVCSCSFLDTPSSTYAKFFILITPPPPSKKSI